MTEQPAENKQAATSARQLSSSRATTTHRSTGKVDDPYQEIVGRIVEACDPDKIILFGSRARGDHRPNSDVDILVIKESSEPRYKRDGPLYTALATYRSRSTCWFTPRKRSATGPEFARRCPRRRSAKAS